SAFEVIQMSPVYTSSDVPVGWAHDFKLHGNSAYYFDRRNHQPVLDCDGCFLCHHLARRWRGARKQRERLTRVTPLRALCMLGISSGEARPLSQLPFNDGLKNRPPTCLCTSD